MAPAPFNLTGSIIKQVDSISKQLYEAMSSQSTNDLNPFATELTNGSPQPPNQSLKLTEVAVDDFAARQYAENDMISRYVNAMNYTKLACSPPQLSSGPLGGNGNSYYEKRISNNLLHNGLVSFMFAQFNRT